MGLSIKGVLIDIDGTVVDRERAVPGAAEAIGWLREREIPFRFATNITRKPRSAIADELSALGITCRPDEILTATSAAARWLRARDVKRIELLLPTAAHEEFSGFEIGTNEPEVVVVGDLGSDWTFDTLNRAFRLLMDGASLLAIQKNRYWREESGLTLDCGAFVAALEHASGLTATIAGKPSAAFYDSAAAELSVWAGDIAMIGDDLESDVVGARRAGLRGVMVRTGKYRAQDEDRAVRSANLVIDSLSDLPSHLDR